MKDINDHIESPFILKLSFDALFKHYEQLVKSDDKLIAANATYILSKNKDVPILREGFSDLSILTTYEEEIKEILQHVFPPVLTFNEIKTASIPLHNLIFNASERFKSILKNAGKDFQLHIKNMPDEDKYRVACVIIMNYYYNYKIDFKRPFFYEIPDGSGIVRTYKIMYNAEFTEIFPTSLAPAFTEADYQQLLENFEDIALWKQKFPPKSYILKGFAINSMFDVTDDTAISQIKSSLMVAGKRQDENFIEELQCTFESLFNIKGIKVGFIIYNEKDSVFERVIGKGIESFLLFNEDVELCRHALCESSYRALVEENVFFSISDVMKYYELSNGEAQYKTFHDQGIKSAILAPIATNGKLLGVLELVSENLYELNSVNANKLIDVMPYIVSSVLRSKAEEENLIEAVIQHECTAIHSSVVWKFRNAAKKFLMDRQHLGVSTVFGEIVFKDVYPLFGQIDVKGSSDARNLATQKDLSMQLTLIQKIISKVFENHSLPIYERLKLQLENYREEIEHHFKVDSEHEVTNFIKSKIEPLFKELIQDNSNLKEDLEDYFTKVDSNLEVIYYYRKNYDDTITLINKNMSALIDAKQIKAQQMYPHYFERYKTDGVEHNMYIGESITKEDSFNEKYLYNLRLWQLQVMCEMECDYYQNRKNYPLGLDVASMILVFNQPMSIRFRMDEKRFDVDGTYNARYEVVKKRIDKAFIKDTEERITTKGKITIVYAQKTDEEEYIKYISFLQTKNILGTPFEIVEIQDLQGVTGLKAIRAPILYHPKTETANFYHYEDLIKEVND